MDVAFDTGRAMASRRAPRMLLLGMALAWAGLAGAQQTVVASSSFSAGREGWTISTLFQPTTTSMRVSWSSEGGNPGGHILTNIPDMPLLAFAAPASFLGDRSSLYGGVIEFALNPNVTVPMTEGLFAVISSGSVNLQLFVPTSVSAGWNTFSLAVYADGLWEVAPTDPDRWGEHGVVATEQQMRDVLSNLTSLRIPALYQQAGVHTMEVSLDEVRLISPVPEPHAAVLMLAGVGLLGLRWRRRVAGAAS